MDSNDSIINNSESALEFVCEPAGNKWAYAVLMPLPLLAGTINLLVWLAATCYRKKLLRQSYVYSCVTSTLISNALFLSFHLWEEIAGFMMPDEMAIKPPGERMQLLWTICTAASVSMLFVVCGNVTVLIYVMLDSTYFHKSQRHRSTTANCKVRKVLTTSELEVKRRRAAYLVAFVWLLPLVLTIAAVLKWNCAGVCHCSPGSLGEICPQELGCSRTWMPMENSFIAVNIALWFVEVGVLIYVTVTGIKNYQDYNAKSSTRTRSSTISVDRSPIFHQKGLPEKNSEFLKSSTSETTATFDKIATEKIVTRSDHTKMKKKKDKNDDVFTSSGHHRRFFSINPRLRLVSYLSVTFIICTVMVPIAFFVDLGSNYYPSAAFRVTSMVFVQVYTLLCPVLLVRYMSNLKTAMVRMTSSVLRCKAS